jgi:murein DD-endopeptidase MepM/ murein hydrolase activator NlpD
MPSLSSAYGGAFTETRDGVALIAAPNETFKETVVKEIEEASEDEAVSEEKVEAAPAPESPTFINPIPSARINQGLHGHNGIDLGAAVGTPIIASRGGTVKTSISGGWNGGYGSYIVISHADGTETLYAHLAANYVSSGVTVTQGQAIGEVGMTGRTTGPHLHYEVHGASNHLAY